MSGILWALAVGAVGGAVISVREARAVLRATRHTRRRKR